jgi:hypothetical protein
MKFLKSKENGDQVYTPPIIIKNHGNPAPSIFASDLRIKGNITTTGEIQMGSLIIGTPLVEPKH